MNTISVKLEQIQKVKGEMNVISIRSKAIDVEKINTIEGQIEAIKKIREGFQFTIDLATQSGAKVVTFGGVKFRLTSKFTIYLNVNGNDFSFDEINQFFEGATSKENTFKKGAELTTDLFAILRNAVGQSPILPMTIIKTIDSQKALEA
jgi:hypothetical protein